MTVAEVMPSNVMEFLEQVKADRSRIERLYEMLEIHVEINQRLTASYGTERVQGGAIFTDPVLSAIIKADRQANFARSQLMEIYENMEYAKYVISLVDDEQQRRCLYQFYIMDRPLYKIAQNLNCSSKAWAYRLLRKAKRALQEEFAK